MTNRNSPRRGSLQFWPRKRANKLVPRVNWVNVISRLDLQENKSSCNFLGFIGYKVGMKSAYVKDSTPHSMTKNKRIVLPITIIECPPMKIFSIRLYKDNKVLTEIINSNLDKELKRKLKLPKSYNTKKKLEELDSKTDIYDDLRVIVYSVSKKTSIKKTPDLIEIALNGSKQEKLEIIKQNLTKEISSSDILQKGLVDIRGITKGFGTQGPVKRFGVKLRNHKSEKGRRGPGSIGPWHPSRVSFRIPMAGQTGYFTRVCFNGHILESKKISEKDINPKEGFKNYGKIKTEYILLNGSVQGPSKRQLVLTKAYRPTKKQLKKQYEVIEIR